MAADLANPACAHCADDFPTALACAREHGTLIGRLHSLTDRAGRRLAHTLATGTTSPWD